MKYIVHHQRSEQPAFSKDEILSKLKSKQFEWTDYVYDEGLKDWVTLMEHVDFAPHFEKWNHPVAASVPPEKTHELSDNHHWFVLRDDNRYGPFTYLEVVKMLQAKKVFEFDYVWNRNSMTSWERISEVAEFSPEKIKALKDSGGEGLEDVFFRRRHARAHYGASIILHNNQEVWRGDSIELSAGGAGLLIDTENIQLGQSLFLHFKAGDGVPPFNAVCTIISKVHFKDEKYRYGVKFTSISQSVQRAIKKYTDQAA